MPKKKSPEALEAENKLLREIVESKRDKIKAAKPQLETIPKKIAAVEAHKEIIKGRNIGALGIGSLILSIMVMLIHNIAGTITAMIGVGILGWFTVMRSKAAQYLEQKYGLTPKPIFNPPTKPPQDLPTFKGM